MTRKRNDNCAKLYEWTSFKHKKTPEIVAFDVFTQSLCEIGLKIAKLQLFYKGNKTVFGPSRTTLTCQHAVDTDM